MLTRLRTLRRLSPLVILFGFLASAGGHAAEPELDLEAYRGHVVLLDFWASWCGPCRDSFPWLNEMQDKYADDGLVIVGVNVDSERDAAERFLEFYPASFAITFDPQGRLARQYEIVAMPSSVLLDRQGNVIERHHGFRHKKRAEYEQNLVNGLKPHPEENSQ